MSVFEIFGEEAAAAATKLLKILVGHPMLLLAHVLDPLDLLLVADVGAHHVDARLVQRALRQALEVLVPAVEAALRFHTNRLLLHWFDTVR